MKKEQRAIYLVLTDEINCSLCTFCKHAEFTGSLCEAIENDCRHPLKDKSWEFDKQVESAYEQGDCWGFRPAYPVEFVADVVGIVLAKGWDGGFTFQEKEGVWVVSGLSLSSVE